MVRHTKEERWQQLAQFLTFHERFPSTSSQNKAEVSLATWVNGRRSYSFLNDPRHAEDIELLQKLHPGILGKKEFDITKHPTPDKWQQHFDTWDSSTTDTQQYTHPITHKPWIVGANSCKEYMVKKFNIMHHITPSECTTQSQPGTMQNVLSYVLHPHYYNLPPAPQMPQYTENINPLQSSNRPGRYFTPENNIDLNPSLDNAINNLMPNNLISNIRKCIDEKEVKALLLKNVSLFDAFTFRSGGYSTTPVNIMETTYNQPRRTSFSCTILPPTYFSLLNTKVQRLYSYTHVHGRPQLSDMQRPMVPSLFQLGIQTWQHVWHSLSPLSQVCPPTHVQLMVYTDTQEAGSNNIRKSGEIGFHHDNKDYASTLAKTSHIPGTDVITTTVGDSMTYSLVGPDITDCQTAKNMTGTNARQSSGNSKLAKHIDLVDGSIYVHTPEDDVNYMHSAAFPDQSEFATPTRVRCALVWRWVGRHKYYRSDSKEDKCIKYSAINRSDILQLKGWMESDKWFKAMGYINANGDNTITHLIQTPC